MRTLAVAVALCSAPSLAVTTFDVEGSGPIGDLQTVEFLVDVTEGDLLRNLNVRISIEHEAPSDLEAFLISPTGTRVELFSGVGFPGANFEDTLLDDSAELSITEGIAPFLGSYRPEGMLNDFDGEDPNGIWTLEIADVTVLSSGTLYKKGEKTPWGTAGGTQLSVDAKNSTPTVIPEPLTGMLSLLGTALLGIWLTHRRNP